MSAALAATLISDQFPELAGARVELLAEGWDNTVYRVDRRWVFRFPRRAVALPGIAREVAVLPLLADRLPLPVPRPRFVGVPASGYPWPFWGAGLLPGRELAELPPDTDLVAAAGPVGAFLRRLHDTDRHGLDLPRDPMRRGEPAVRAPMVRERLTRLRGRLATARLPQDAVRDLLAAGGRLDAPPEGSDVVSHGDLHLRHLLVDDAGHACAVIDWGDCCLADPAVDLSIAYAGFAGAARQALLTAYGPVAAERELRARVVALSLCAALADQAAAQGDRRLLTAALAGLHRAVDAGIDPHGG